MWCRENSAQDETEKSSDYVEHVHNSKPQLVFSTSNEEYHVQEEAKDLKNRHSAHDVFDFQESLLESVTMVKQLV